MRLMRSRVLAPAMSLFCFFKNKEDYCLKGIHLRALVRKTSPLVLKIPFSMFKLLNHDFEAIVTRTPTAFNHFEKVEPFFQSNIVSP